MPKRVMACASDSLAVEIELERRLAENLGARRRVRHRIVEPVDRGLIGKLALVADEGTIARPHQAIGPGDAKKFTGIVDRFRSKPIAARHLDPGAALVDRAQQRLEAFAVDAGLSIWAAEMIDHDLDAGGLRRGQDFRQVPAFAVRMNVPGEIGGTADPGT